MKGRVIRVSGQQYLVETEPDLWLCDLRGRLKGGVKETQSPVFVGDWVEIEPTGSGTGVIDDIYPRYSKFSRGASGYRLLEQIVAVNLDQLAIVVAICKPRVRTGFIDRAVVMAHHGRLVPIVCVNKIDLDQDGQRFTIGQIYQKLGYQVCYTSALSGEGIESFNTLLKGRVSAVIGPSGVGKSSLLNRISPGLAIKTQELMKQHDRGRHTTAAVRLYRLSGGGYVADTPGIKDLVLWGVDRQRLAGYFTEMKPLIASCQFRNCTHLHEPRCAVQDAVEQGRIAAVRYEGYRRIMESL
jgi:ribosome biogenesis GTPase / thiamine phosphate phosphatase